MRWLVLVVLLPLALVGCGAEDYATLEPRNPDRAADGLVLTLPDGSTSELPDAIAVCVPSRANPELEVVRLVAPATAYDDPDATPSLTVEVTPGLTSEVRLPLTVRDPGAGPSDVTVVARTPDGQSFTGSAGSAEGSLSITEATCDPEARVSLTMDVTLGHGVGRAPGRQSLTVRGGMANSARN